MTKKYHRPDHWAKAVFYIALTGAIIVGVYTSQRIINNFFATAPSVSIDKITTECFQQTIKNKVFMVGDCKGGEK